MAMGCVRHIICRAQPTTTQLKIHLLTGNFLLRFLHLSIVLAHTVQVEALLSHSQDYVFAPAV